MWGEVIEHPAAPRRPFGRWALGRATTRRGSLAMFAVVVVLGSFPIGCGSSQKAAEDDAVEVAIEVNRNLQEGRKLMGDAVADWNMDDPSDNPEGLSKLLKAEEHFSEARRLSANSSQPRIALGNCRSLIGYVYFSKYESARVAILQAEEDGQIPPGRLVTRRDENLEKSREWLQSANRELEFYVRFLMQRFPNTMVYEQLATNYEYLGDYERSEAMIRAFLRESKDLTRDQRRAFEARARALRQKRLEEFEG